MNIEQTITDKLSEALTPAYLSVEDESYMHSSGPGAQSHFKVIVASAEFAGKSLVDRHRIVNRILAQELAGPVHALALHTHSDEEWEATPDVLDSPPCRSGSKAAFD